jgi:hypothetical protein
MTHRRRPLLADAPMRSKRITKAAQIPVSRKRATKIYFNLALFVCAIVIK